MKPYSQLRAEKRTNLASAIPLAAPWTVLIEPINSCNFACTFCPESLPDYHEIAGKHKMDWRTYERVIEQLTKWPQLKRLAFYCLGEPLLHPDLPKMITLAKDTGVSERIEITTNASCLTEKKSLELIHSGLDYLRVSIYGMTKEKFQKTTQSQLDPDKIRHNIERFEYLRKEENTASPFLYLKMIDLGDTEENRLFVEAYEPIADEICLEKQHDWTGDGLGPKTAGGRKICPSPFYTSIVCADGQVTCCCVDWSKKTAIGSIHENTLQEIWNGDKAKAFRQMHLEGRRHENEACAGCTYLNTFPDDIDSLLEVK